MPVGNLYQHKFIVTSLRINYLKTKYQDADVQSRQLQLV